MSRESSQAFQEGKNGRRKGGGWTRERISQDRREKPPSPLLLPYALHTHLLSSLTRSPKQPNTSHTLSLSLSLSPSLSLSLYLPLYLSLCLPLPLTLSRRPTPLFFRQPR